MAEFCGQCSKKMGFPPKTWKYGNFDYLLNELKADEEETVLCEGCGWITHGKVTRYFI